MMNWKPIKKFLPTVLVFALSLLILGQSALAAVPRTMSVQGVLTDASGAPLADGQHYSIISIYNALVGGSQVWEGDVELETVKGVFSTVLDLGNVSASHFANELWLEINVGGETMTPRIPLTAVPYSQHASMADAIVGGGTADNDWEFSGNDIYRLPGRVFVGNVPTKEQPAPREGAEEGNRDVATAKLVVSNNQCGVYSSIYESDTVSDGRSAIYGARNRMTRNDGVGFGPTASNSAITGYNTWGDSFTFGMAGYTWFDNPHTAAVMGQAVDTGNWAALAYKDAASTEWGIYTPTDLHVGGLIETDMLQIFGGAAAGHVLTSDVSGNASWQPPGAAVTDDDWVIQGDDLSHDGGGTVAIGTDNPVPFIPAFRQATLQIVAPYHPAVVLEKTTGTPGRWNMYVDGTEAVLNFGTSNVTGTVLNPFLSLSNYQMLIRNESGATKVTISADHLGTGEGRIITPVLEITGGSDLSEQFDIESLGQTIEPGMVVRIDPDRPGQLTLSDRKYDRRVAGVVSGAGGVNPGMLMGQKGSEADGEMPVALVGRVYVWADATCGKIEPGDLLTTADRPGHAMRVSDSAQGSGAILGKAMTNLDNGQGLVLVLVSLQ